MNKNEAYVFMGHGNEENDSFIVPKGHIIIAISHSGDGIEHDQSKYKAILDHDNKKYILDPLNNIGKITELLGPVAIYKGNDDPDPKKRERCPKFNHQIWHGHNFTNEIKNDGICKDPYKNALWPSGLIKITNSSKLYDSKDRFIKYLDTGLCTYALESDTYNEDIRKEAIKNIEQSIKLDPKLLSLWRSYANMDENTKLTPYHLIKKFKESYRDKTVISQEELCNNHPAEDGQYIITYVVNCRSIQGYEFKFVTEADRATFLGINKKIIFSSNNARYYKYSEDNLRDLLGLKDVPGDIIELIIEKYKTYDIDSDYYKDALYIFPILQLIIRLVEYNRDNKNKEGLLRIKNKVIKFAEIIIKKDKDDRKAREVGGMNVIDNNDAYFLLNQLVLILEDIKEIESRIGLVANRPLISFRKNTFSHPVPKQISEAFKQRRNTAQAYIQNRTKKNERKQNIYRVLNKKENIRNNTNRQKLNNFRKDFPDVENDYIIDRTRNATNSNLNTRNRNNLTKRLNRLETLSRKRLNNNSVKYGIKKVTRALERKSNAQGMENMRAMEV